MQARIVNVTDLVENQKLGRFFWNVMAWCLLVSLGDGYDYTAMAFAAPAVIKAMHVERSAMGSVFGAGLFGIMLGSMVFGYIGDRLGRKRAIVIGCLFFGALTFATMFARSLDALLYLRFIAGLGIGRRGAQRDRAHQRIFATAIPGNDGDRDVRGLPAGLGRRWICRGGSCSVLRLAIGLLRRRDRAVPDRPRLPRRPCPESIRLLAVQQKNRTELAALARRMQPILAIAADTQFVLAEERDPKRFTIPLLFSGDRRIATPLLWLLYIANSLALFFLSSWMPVLLEGAGLPPGHAALAGSLFSIGGLIGSLAIMRFTDRYGAIAITLLPLAGIPIVAALGMPGTTELFLLSAVFLAGGCTAGAQSGIHSVAGMFYPVSYRANGVGWALSIAKIGSIAGPVIGGILLSAHLPLQQLFLTAASPLVVVLLSCIVLGWVYLTRFAKKGKRSRSDGVAGVAD